MDKTTMHRELEQRLGRCIYAVEHILQHDDMKSSLKSQKAHNGEYPSLQAFRADCGNADTFDDLSENSQKAIKSAEKLLGESDYESIPYQELHHNQQNKLDY